MMKAKLHPGNYERCRKLLQNFQSRRLNIDLRQIHSFIGWADRNTLRAVAYFNPLQKMMGSLAQQLVKDKYIASFPSMLAKTSNIYLQLNYYSTRWMQHSERKLIQWIEQKKTFDLQEVAHVYRLFVELGYQSNQQAATIIRKKVIQTIIKSIQQSKPQELQKTLAIIHREIKILLMDRQLNIPQIMPLLEILQKHWPHQAKTQDNYHYVHTAKTKELLDLRGVKLQDQFKNYHNSVKKAYNSYKDSIGRGSYRENSSSEFSKQGQSVFEYRVQRHLDDLGFWFQRNKVVGLHQFDILLKGRLRQPFRPFFKFKDSHQLAKGRPIEGDELKLFESMEHIWKIEKRQQWSEPLLLNLNGPFHYIEGDKQGVLRSEAIKKQIAQIHGFKRYASINYKDWQRQTPNKGAVKQYIDKLLSLN